MNLYRDIKDIDKEKYIIATYLLSSATSIKEAAWNIAIGQSVGNPNVRNEWENDELFEKHSCLILENPDLLNKKESTIVKIAFPVNNADWNTDGINQLICHLMGGHLDINLITSCRLIKLDLPDSFKKYFLGPKFGLSGIRKLTGQYNKPLFGSIIKPKIGISPETLLEITKQLVDGGVDFIKEDEIMSNPHCCPLEKRVEIISNYLSSQSKKIIFCHTINCDPGVLTDRVKTVYNLGGNGVHINVYSGLGSYNSVRKLDLPIAIHFQKSGDKIFTDRSHRFSIAWPVICQLATLMGVDTIQTGMIGGYSNDDPDELLNAINMLRSGNTVPALSCGFHAGLVDEITSKIGYDYLANVGGAIHGHISGTLSGAKAIRQAIDKNYQNEYYEAINMEKFK